MCILDSLWGNTRKFIFFTKHTKHSTPLAVADRSCLRRNTPVIVKCVFHFKTITDSGQHYSTSASLVCLEFVPNPDCHCKLHFTLIKQHQQASVVQQKAFPSVSLLTGPITSALTEWTYSAIDHHCARVSFWGHGQLHVSQWCATLEKNWTPFSQILNGGIFASCCPACHITDY